MVPRPPAISLVVSGSTWIRSSPKPQGTRTAYLAQLCAKYSVRVVHTSFVVLLTSITRSTADTGISSYFVLGTRSIAVIVLECAFCTLYYCIRTGSRIQHTAAAQLYAVSLFLFLTNHTFAIGQYTTPSAGTYIAGCMAADERTRIQLAASIVAFPSSLPPPPPLPPRKGSASSAL